MRQQVLVQQDEPRGDGHPSQTRHHRNHQLQSRAGGEGAARRRGSVGSRQQGPETRAPAPPADAGSGEPACRAQRQPAHAASHGAPARLQRGGSGERRRRRRPPPALAAACRLVACRRPPCRLPAAQLCYVRVLPPPRRLASVWCHSLVSSTVLRLLVERRRAVGTAAAGELPGGNAGPSSAAQRRPITPAGRWTRQAAGRAGGV